MKNIKTTRPHEFESLMPVWEASVRATHDFISDADIKAFKPAILNEYLPALSVKHYVDEGGDILGFVGVGAGKIEMLFIAPQSRGKGIGKLLLQEAIEQMGATTLDVNEQNPQAVGFYQHMGFIQVGRSELDGEGNPFPLLHMALAEK